MKLRVKNTSAGQRGVWIEGKLEFVDGGTAKMFDGSSAAERDAAVDIDGLFVQSSLNGDDWTDHSAVKMPEPQPWLAYATDGFGTNMKTVDTEGAWYVGVALASEKPEDPAGYSWVKMGGDAEAVELAATDPLDGFDASKVVEDTAPNVIAALSGKTPEQIAAIRVAEEVGQKRKGVLKAIDDLTVS